MRASCFASSTSNGSTHFFRTAAVTARVAISSASCTLVSSLCGTGCPLHGCPPGADAVGQFVLRDETVPAVREQVLAIGVGSVDHDDGPPRLLRKRVEQDALTLLQPFVGGLELEEEKAVAWSGRGVDDAVAIGRAGHDIREPADVVAEARLPPLEVLLLERFLHHFEYSPLFRLFTLYIAESSKTVTPSAAKFSLSVFVPVREEGPGSR